MGEVAHPREAEGSGGKGSIFSVFLFIVLFFLSCWICFFPRARMTHEINGYGDDKS